MVFRILETDNCPGRGRIISVIVAKRAQLIRKGDKIEGGEKLIGKARLNKVFGRLISGPL